MKWLSVIALACALAAAALWMNRIDVALGFVELMAQQRLEVGPNRDVRWASGADPRGRAAQERPPNIVWIVADDLGWNDITYGGGGVAGGTVPTPNIDSIATEGVNFAQGYAANATCAPSRAALLSGRYGTRFGFEFTPTPEGFAQLGRIASQPSGRLRGAIVDRDAEIVEYGFMGMPASEITIAELLSEAGYHTVHIGKWQLGREHGMAPEEQGFEESLLLASGLYLPTDHPDAVNASLDHDLVDRFFWAAMRFAASFNGGTAFEPDEYLTNYYTQQAVEVTDANAERPFFLYLAHLAPHTVLQAHRSDYDALGHIEDHKARVHAAMIRALDRGVGEVLDALERNGLSDNTLVVFTSDNGAPANLGLPNVNHPFRGWKNTYFHGGLRVPFFVRWPARIPAGSKVADPVQHFDLYATAAAAAGVPLPEDRAMDGVDLLPYVTGEAVGVPHRTLFWRSGASQSALVDGWKLNVSDPPGRNWLFDVRVDPLEQRDLSRERPQKLAELQAELAAHNAEQARSAWPSTIAVPVNLDKDLTLADAPDDEYIYWSN